MIECAGGLLGLPVFLHYGNRIGKVDFRAVFLVVLRVGADW